MGMGFPWIALGIFFMFSLFVVLDAADLTMEQIEHPYRHLSAWLQEAYPELKTLKLKQLSRGITLLASSQKTFKSMDGVAHEINARVGSAGGTRELEAVRAAAALDEAQRPRLAALVRDLRRVREALGSAEIAEVAQKPSEAEALATAAGWKSNQEGEDEPDQQGKPWVQARIDVFSGEDDNTCAGRVTALAFIDSQRNRLVISVGDDLGGAALVAAAARPARRLTVRPRGAGRSPLEPPRPAAAAAAALGAAADLVAQIGPNITDFLSENANSTVHFAGHSFGGSVAALASAILEGALACPELPPACAPHCAAAQGRVAAATFGAPPCLSSGVPCGAFVTAWALGDDLGPRLGPAALGRLKGRLARAVPAAGGGFLSQGLTMGAGVLKDALWTGTSKTAGHALGLGEGEKKAAEELAPAGRLYYLKPRRYQGAATLQEVKGNLREDVLWQLDEIFLSKSMLKHHSLAEYVSNLDRV